MLVNVAFGVHAIDGVCRLDFDTTTAPGERPVPEQLIADSRQPFSRAALKLIPAGGFFEKDVDLATRFQFTDEGPYSIVVIYESAYHGPIKGVRGRRAAGALLRARAVGRLRALVVEWLAMGLGEGLLRALPTQPSMPE